MLKSRTRETSRTGWPLAAVLSVFLLAGCGGKVDNVHRAAGFDPLAADGARFAVGGFVLGPGVQVDPDEGGAEADLLAADPTAQSDTWAGALYGPLLAGRGGRDVWAWSALRDNLPGDSITALQTAFAGREKPAPAVLAAVAGDLPDVRYLALARLDRNDIMISDVAPGGLRNESRDAGAEPGAVPNSLLNTVKIRRTVTVTLEVFDLRGGDSVWRGTVERQRTELLSSKSIAERENVVVTPPATEGGLPSIRVRGASLAAPALADVLADACEALAADLFEVER